MHSASNYNKSEPTAVKWQVRSSTRSMRLSSQVPLINSARTRCIVKTSGFTRGVCKNWGFFIKFKGFLVEFMENRRSWENQKPPENRQKWTFLGLAFYNAPSLHTVDLLRTSVRDQVSHGKSQQEEPVVGAQAAPTAISNTFPPLARRISKNFAFWPRLM